MAAFKDKNGTWFTSFRFTDWKGERKQKLKRGFPTKREALEWERQFLQQKTADLNMSFEAFVKLYIVDMQNRIREHTWETKHNIIDTKILPYFKDKIISEIKPPDIITWQNEIMKLKSKSGKPYSATYLKTIHNQLSAIFNHAVRFYELKSNPAAKVGSIGKKETTNEMLFWTKDEYKQFAEAMMDKPVSFYAFEVLYWCGVRMGEMLALTPVDFDFAKGTVRINKSYQRIKGRDVVTEPKTPKSNRIIQMPDFLCEEIQEYIKSLYGVKPTDRMFPMTKSRLHKEMDRGCLETGIKPIRGVSQIMCKLKIAL